MTRRGLPDRRPRFLPDSGTPHAARRPRPGILSTCGATPATISAGRGGIQNPAAAPPGGPPTPPAARPARGGGGNEFARVAPGSAPRETPPRSEAAYIPTSATP